MRHLNTLICCVAMTCLSACSTAGPIVGLTETITGGVAGAGLGAGAGALIANSMSNGDVTASAIAGAGIGLAAGAIIGAAYTGIAEDLEVSANQSQIDSNHAAITENESDMVEVREGLRRESDRMDVDSAAAEYIYTGPVLGQYNR